MLFETGCGKKIGRAVYTSGFPSHFTAMCQQMCAVGLCRQAPGYVGDESFDGMLVPDIHTFEKTRYQIHEALMRRLVWLQSLLSWMPTLRKYIQYVILLVLTTVRAEHNSCNKNNKMMVLNR